MHTLESRLNPRVILRDMLAEEMQRIGVSHEGIQIMAKKGRIILIKLENLSRIECNILKQTMLSAGGDVAVHKNILDEKTDKSDALIIGTRSQFLHLLSRLREQPWRMPDIARIIEKTVQNFTRNEFVIKTPKGDLQTGRKTLIMGILNVTPDSFYDGGRYLDKDRAIEHAIYMFENGADIIDVGGESTRPGSKPVSPEEEIQRVIPVIEGICRRLPDEKISIDTYKSVVAESAIKAGACIVNDVSAMRFDERMVEVVAEYRVPVVLMHMKGRPQTMQDNPYYEDVVSEITGFLRERINFAEKHGIDQIIIDPGIGFGKTYENNLELLRRLREFKSLGRPILAGTSRKSFIGHFTGKGVEDRLYGTIATVCCSILNGADIIRVHEVEKIKDAVVMCDLVKIREGHEI
jgi:dihydropteroate synthase